MNTLEEVELVIGGRHDSCIVPRAVAAVEAAVAVAILDKITENGCEIHGS
jgi:chorismate synthase